MNTIDEKESKAPIVSLFDPQTNRLITQSDDPDEIQEHLANADIQEPDNRMPLFLVVYANGYKTFVRQKNLEETKQLYEKFKDSIFPKPEFPLNIIQVIGDQLNTVMSEMHESWKYYWCESGACGCMGCGNRSGRLSALGFEKEEWQQWVASNPNPTPPKDPLQEREALGKALREALGHEVD